MKRITKHIGYYISLVAILTLSFFLAYSTSNKIFQLGVVIVTTFLYVMWGLIHHLLDHDLHPKIVIEYILIGTFGLTIIFFLLSVSGNY